MELNLKILAPLLQCTSINRCALCAVHESKKKKKKIILPHPLKNYLIFSLTPCPSLSLSLSQSLNSHPLPKLFQSLKLSSSLSHSPLTVDRLTVPSHRSPIASLSQAADRLTVTLLSADPAHQPTPSADPTRRHCACLWLVIVDLVWSRLRKKIGDLGFFFFFLAVDCWWWWWWWLWL